jgi:outer membrane lipoprotein SlyB
MKKTIIVILCSAMLAGCATYRPICDMRGIDRNQYEQDLKECQQYAEQVSPGQSAGAGALIGGALGAATGLVVGAILNVKPGQLAALGAAVGGMGGATRAGAGAAMNQQQIIKTCMANRGYSVLN